MKSKRVLITVYYLDFARYWVSIAQYLQERMPGLHIEFLCFFPSAYHYLQKKGFKSIRVYKEVLSHDSGADERDVHYYDYIKKVRPSLFKGGRLRSLIVSESISLRRLVESSLINVDLVISSGDSRPQTKILLDVIKDRGIKTLFFEQGPFGTTLLDPVGVNANVSFRPSFDSRFRMPLGQLSSMKKGKPFFDELSLLERFSCYWDLVYQMTPRSLISFFPIYTQTGDNFFVRLSKRLRYLNFTSSPTALPSKFILVALQVPNDAQMTEHSHLYSQFSDMLIDIIDATPEEYSIVVREHPMYRGRYSKDLYKQIDGQRVILDSDTQLIDQIDNACVVVVNNSMTGLDAISLGRNVVVLGDAYYKYEEICFPVFKKEQLVDQLRRAINEPFPLEKAETFFGELVQNYLISGHFQDKVISNIKEVSLKVFDMLSQNR